MATNTQLNETTKLNIKRPRKYKVIMYNDDFTPMDFVVDILITIFHKNEEDAFALMMAVHKSTKAVVGTYSYDIAKTKAERSVSLAREQGYPFRVTVEE